MNSAKYSTVHMAVRKYHLLCAVSKFFGLITFAFGSFLICQIHLGAFTYLFRRTDLVGPSK